PPGVAAFERVAGAPSRSPLSDPSSLHLSAPQPPPQSPLFPYTTLFRSAVVPPARAVGEPSGFGISRFRRHHRSRHHPPWRRRARSEEHTSELQSRSDRVCRLLLEKKNTAASPRWDFVPNAQPSVRRLVV